MNDLLAKLSSYNIFNYLFPGALFVFAMEYLGGLTIKPPNVVVEAFVYYFIGMTISRVGSLLVEGLYLKLGLVEYADYRAYVAAKSKDKDIAMFLEQNNVYRTMVALIICLVTTNGVILLIDWLELPKQLGIASLLTAAFVIYSQSYRKQTMFIKKRVEIANNTNSK